MSAERRVLFEIMAILQDPAIVFERKSDEASNDPLWPHVRAAIATLALSRRDAKDAFRNALDCYERHPERLECCHATMQRLREVIGL